MSSSGKRTDGEVDRDCLPCRLIGCAALAGAGVYVYPGRVYMRPSEARVAAGDTYRWFRFRQMFAGALVVAGVLRLAGGDNLGRVTSLFTSKEPR